MTKIIPGPLVEIGPVVLARKMFENVGGRQNLSDIKQRLRITSTINNKISILVI